MKKMINIILILIIISSCTCCNNKKSSTNLNNNSDKIEKKENKKEKLVEKNNKKGNKNEEKKQIENKKKIYNRFEIEGFDTPESFQYCKATGKLFVSNILGAPSKKDGKGYISRIDIDGKIDIKEFIIGLDAPKGITFIKDNLYVTDIDKVKGFSAKTAKKIFEISLSHLRARFLNDIVAYKDILYVSDTQAGKIFKIIPSKNKVEVFNENIKGPNGVAINPITKNLWVVTWIGGKVIELDQNGKIKDILKREFHNLDGIDFDSRGNMYISDFTEGKIYKITPDYKVTTLLEDLETPADISILDDVLLLIPCFKKDKILGIPLK